MTNHPTPPPKAPQNQTSQASGLYGKHRPRVLVAEFEIPGEPISKSRARFTKKGSKTVAYTPERTRQGEQQVLAAFLTVNRHKELDINKAFAVECEFHCGTRQRRDVDNMTKLVLDGLNGWAYPDDNQVLEIWATKEFVDKGQEKTIVRLYGIGDMNFDTIACKNCGAHVRVYASTRGVTSYCSESCRREHATMLRIRRCAQCGKEFEAHSPHKEYKFCSKECAYESKRTVTNCAICGALFSIQNCHIRKRNYCSDGCKREQDRIAHKRRRSKYFPGVCSACGAGTTRKEYKRCNRCKRRGVEGNAILLGPKQEMLDVQI